MHNGSEENKVIVPTDWKDRRSTARAKSRARITKITGLEYTNLSQQIKALQRAIANERGESQKLRDEIRAHLQRGHW